MTKLILIVVVKTLVVLLPSNICIVNWKVPINVCLTCVDKSNSIKSFVKKIDILSLTVKKQKRNKLLNSKQSRFSWKKVKTAAKMNFYTGLSSIKVLFSALFNYNRTLSSKYFLLGWAILNAPPTKIILKIIQ